MRGVTVLLLALAGAAPVLAEKSQDLRDASLSEPHATATGSWRYTLRRSSRPWSCDGSPGRGLCLEQVVTLDNNSAETLICQLHVDFTRADGSVSRSFESPVLVLPRTHPDLHSAITDDQTQAEVRSLECLARTPYKRVAKVAGCKYDMMGKPFESYYPQEAREKSQQGPVIISFLLKQRLGPPQEVAVAESSLIPLLDQAALRFINDQDFRTNCPGTRFDLLMRFKLREDVASR